MIGVLIVGALIMLLGILVGFLLHALKASEEE